MEVVKENTPETKTPETPKTRTIVVMGVDIVGKQFLLEALCKIISMSGYSVNATPLKDLEGKEVEEQFHVVVAEEFDPDLEIKSRLIYSSFRNPEEILEELKEKTLINTQEREIIMQRFYQLVKWMRSGKLAYTVDINSQENKKGLHNYNVLKNIILTMNFAFMRETSDGQPLKEDGSNGFRFDKIKPQTLIESLVPELKEKSQEASKKFNETVEEKTKDKADENI